MSLYAVHAICRAVDRDAEFRGALAEDPQAVLATWDLTAQEREALLAGDVAGLYAAGANEYVMLWLARAGVLGLTVPTFMDRMRGATPRPID